MNKEIGFKELFSYAAPFRGTLLLITLLMLCESGVALISPWLAGYFTDTMLNPENGGLLTLKQILLGWLAILFLQAALNFSNRYLTGKTGQSMLAVLRTRLYDHLQSLPLGYFHERKHGETLALMTNDAAIINNFITATLTSLLPLLVTFAGAMMLIFLIDPVIALMAGLLIPLFYVIIKVLGRKIRPISKEIVDEYASTFAIVEENLSLLPAIKSFTREEIESMRFKEGNLRLVRLNTSYLRIQALLSPAVRFLAAAAILLLLWITGSKVESGQLTTANLVSLLLYGMLLTRPISGLADVYGLVQQTRGAAQRLIDVFSIQPEPTDNRNILPAVKGDVTLNNIHFSYPGRPEILSQCVQAVGFYLKRFTFTRIRLRIHHALLAVAY